MTDPVIAKQMEGLRPYIAGGASPTGEVDMYCPMHEDRTRSATINFEKGLWYCCAGCGGGTIAQLLKDSGYWVPMADRNLNGAPRSSPATRKPEPLPKLKDLRRWNEALLSDQDRAGSRLARVRGLNRSIMIRYGLGWDRSRKRYIIPVRSAKGKLWNIRRYTLDPGPDERKINGLRGHNNPRIYPAMALVPWDEPIIICGGELDALITIQNGFRCVTRTAAEHVWHSEWNEYFRNRAVYLCHDHDATGQLANERVRAALLEVGTEARTVTLPYPWFEKHGMDLTDFWMDGGTPYKFDKLLEEAK